MDTIARLYDFQPGTPAVSSQVDAELSQLVNTVNAMIGILNGASLPVGSIIPFDDFNGALDFDPEYFCYCDGGVHVVGGASRTVPDLSGRYLVGFGGEGDGDIASATWSGSAVGADDHEIDLEHAHTVNAHYHSLSAHTHSISGNTDTEYALLGAGGLGTLGGTTHRHGVGTLAIGTPSNDTTGYATANGTDNQLSNPVSIQPKSIPVRFIMRIK